MACPVTHRHTQAALNRQAVHPISPVWTTQSWLQLPHRHHSIQELGGCLWVYEVSQKNQMRIATFTPRSGAQNTGCTSHCLHETLIRPLSSCAILASRWVSSSLTFLIYMIRQCENLLHLLWQLKEMIPLKYLAQQLEYSDDTTNVHCYYYYHYS